MPHRQKITTKAKMVMRSREALQLVGEGLRLSDVAAQMRCSVDSVQRYVKRALQTESLFPSSLTAEEVGALRQLQAEVLSNSRRMALETQSTVNGRIGTPAEKSGDAQAIAKLLESITRAVDSEAQLFGTRQPTRIVEESMRIQLTRVDSKVVVSFDREQLRPAWTPLGLTDASGESHVRLGDGNDGS